MIKSRRGGGNRSVWNLGNHYNSRRGEEWKHKVNRFMVEWCNYVTCPHHASLLFYL